MRTHWVIPGNVDVKYLRRMYERIFSIGSTPLIYNDYLQTQYPLHALMVVHLSGWLMLFSYRPKKLQLNRRKQETLDRSEVNPNTCARKKNHAKYLEYQGCPTTRETR